jgi:hypothetical protein
MLLLASAVVVGLLAGWARPPAGAFSAGPRVHRIGLLGGAAALDAAAVLLAGDGAVLAMAGAYVLLLAFAASNRHLTGIVVMAVGILLNLAGLVVNQGMPVRASALVHAGVVDVDEVAATELGGPRHVETANDVAPILGDVVPFAPTREVLSFGDLVIAAGAADTAAELSRRRRRRWSEGDRAAYRSRTTQASVDQVWGIAPSPAPASGSQYSANPDVHTPLVIDLDRVAASWEEPDLVAATQTK